MMGREYMRMAQKKYFHLVERDEDHRYLSSEDTRPQISPLATEGHMSNFCWEETKEK